MCSDEVVKAARHRNFGYRRGRSRIHWRLDLAMKTSSAFPMFSITCSKSNFSVFDFLWNGKMTIWDVLAICSPHNILLFCRKPNESGNIFASVFLYTFLCAFTFGWVQTLIGSAVRTNTVERGSQLFACTTDRQRITTMTSQLLLWRTQSVNWRK